MKQVADEVEGFRTTTLLLLMLWLFCFVDQTELLIYSKSNR